MAWTLIKDLGTELSGQFFDKKQNRYRDRYRRYYLCECNCGKIQKISADDFKNKRTNGCTSCHLTVHGLSRTPENQCWRSMLQRCNNPKNPTYKHYGARGITVCKRWYKFENFFADMGKRPSSKHSIDRIDNDGNYEPNNCKWSTQKEQCNNMRRNKKAA